MNARSFLLAILIAAVFFVAGTQVGTVKTISLFHASSKNLQPQALGPSGLPAAINTDLVQDVWGILHEKYPKPIDDTKLAEGILRGLVGGLGDPYSAYEDPQEAKQFSDNISGSFTGIGVEIGGRQGLLVVISPLKGSPAEKAGIRAQDIIVAIDGKDLTAQSSLTDIVDNIRGPEGTTVHLKIAREGTPNALEFDVKRERIHVESVTSRIENNVAIIEISEFKEDTAKAFASTVRRLLSQHITGIVLDLRNDPGGLLDAAVDIAGHFVPDGQLVVSEVPANPAKTIEHRAQGPNDLQRMPLVVLVNGGSASASEILAGVLRDVRHVPLVGTNTFGKGTVQELINLSDGSSLRVTIAKWVTPSGKELTEDGLVPDVRVEDNIPDDTEDTVLQKGLEVLKQQTAQ